MTGTAENGGLEIPFFPPFSFLFPSLGRSIKQKCMHVLTQESLASTAPFFNLGKAGQDTRGMCCKWYAVEMLSLLLSGVAVGVVSRAGDREHARGLSVEGVKRRDAVTTGQVNRRVSWLTTTKGNRKRGDNKSS